MEDVVEDAKEAFAFVFAMTRADDNLSGYVSQLFHLVKLIATTNDPKDIIAANSTIQLVSFDLTVERLRELHREEMSRLYPQLRDLNVELQGGQ